MPKSTCELLIKPDQVAAVEEVRVWKKRGGAVRDAASATSCIVEICRDIERIMRHDMVALPQRGSNMIKQFKPSNLVKCESLSKLRC